MGKLELVAAIVALPLASGSIVAQDEITRLAIHEDSARAASPSNAAAAQQQRRPQSARYLSQQSLGTAELGVFPQYTRFDRYAGCQCHRPRNAWGPGARAGLFFGNAWQVEADGTPTEARMSLSDGTISYTAVALRVNYNALASLLGSLLNAEIDPRLSALVGVGAVHTQYDEHKSTGLSGIAGVRWALFGPVGLRLDGVADFMPSTNNLNYGTRIGVSFHVGLPGVPMIAEQPAPQPATEGRVSVGVAAGEVELRPRGGRAPTAAELAELTGPVFFDYDKATLRPDALAILERKVAWFVANPTARIRVEGNTDERGSRKYNHDLGAGRAEAAIEFFAARGVDRARFTLVSHGKDRPKCKRLFRNDACHQLNRRVDFQVLTGAEGLRAPDME